MRVRRRRRGARCGAPRDGRHQLRGDARRGRRARARADLRRRLVAAGRRSVHRARTRGRVRHAPDPAPAAPGARSHPVGDPLRARSHRCDALRDRGRHRRLGRDRGSGRGGHRRRRDGDHAVRPARGGARRARPRVRAAARRAVGATDRRRIRPGRATGPGAPRPTGSSTGRRGRRTCTTGSAPRPARTPAPSPSSGRRRSSSGARGPSRSRSDAPAGTVVAVRDEGPVVACGEGGLLLEDVESESELLVGARLG